MTKNVGEHSKKDNKESNLGACLKRTAVLFAVKPLIIIYAMIYAVTKTVNNQLWLDKVCKNNLNYSDDICANLDKQEYGNYTDKVQITVNNYQVIETYLALPPVMLASLYLGPLSDYGRKRVMILPFFGHIISGIFSLLNVYYMEWDARYLWLQESYNIFGGYTVINIAMTGYIGDVTKVKERTALISILTGLTFCTFPLADFVGVQLYSHFGYKCVYWTSFGFVILGIIYINFIPESIIDTNKQEKRNLNDNFCKNWCQGLVTSCKVLTQAFKSIIRKRETGERKILFFILALGLMGSVRTDENGLLYTQKKFGWTAQQYGYYSSFSTLHIAVKSLLVLPFLSYYLQVHDCLIGVLGYLSEIEENLVFAFATKGWMFYYGSALSAFGGSTSTPETSILLKCVPASEIGAVYTLFGLLRTLCSYALLSVMKTVYNETIDVFPGSAFAISAAIKFLSLLLMLWMFYEVIKNERKYGPLGKRK